MLTNKKVSIDDVIEIFVRKSEGKVPSEEDFLTFRQYSLSETPKKIYRYRSLDERELCALKESKVWFSKILTLNDPFEFHCRLNIGDLSALDEETQKIIRILPPMKSALLIKNQLKISKDKFLSEFADKVAIACVSEKNDTLLMWAHYSNKHHGICIEYDAVSLSASSGATLLPVNYSNELPELLLSDRVGMVREAFHMMRTKAKEWDYEYEWRYISISSGGLIDAPAPKAVYLGVNAEGQFVEELTRVCKEVLKIPLYKMAKSRDEYKLIPKRIV